MTECDILPLGQTVAEVKARKSGDPSINTNIDPIQYMKKLRTNGSQPSWISPPSFNPSTQLNKPIVFDGEYNLLCGKKYFMRFVQNQGRDYWWPRNGMKRIRWLGDLQSSF